MPHGRGRPNGPTEGSLKGARAQMGHMGGAGPTEGVPRRPGPERTHFKAMAPKGPKEPEGPKKPNRANRNTNK